MDRGKMIKVMEECMADALDILDRIVDQDMMTTAGFYGKRVDMAIALFHERIIYDGAEHIEDTQNYVL